MGMFDQAGRTAAKMDGAAFTPWLLQQVPTAVRPFAAEWAFVRWEDTRRVPFPGDPDRTEDLLAELTGPDQETAYLAIELFTEPVLGALERVIQYALAVRLEYRGRADRPRLARAGGVVVTLTGRATAGHSRVVLADAQGQDLVLHFAVVNLSEVEAAAALAAVETGAAPRSILPWLPLMKAGGAAEVIAAWKRLAEVEPKERQLLLAALALVFAELTPWQVDWYRALEGWNVKESQLLLGAIREGRAEGTLRTKQEDLLKAIEARLAHPVPEDLRRAIEGTTALDVLEQWFDTALRVSTLAELKAVMRLPG